MNKPNILLAPALYEATRYLPGVRPDPVQPTEAEIQAYLRSSHAQSE
jgi:hypothetical protein